MINFYPGFPTRDKSADTEAISKHIAARLAALVEENAALRAKLASAGHHRDQLIDVSVNGAGAQLLAQLRADLAFSERSNERCMARLEEVEQVRLFSSAQPPAPESVVKAAEEIARHANEEFGMARGNRGISAKDALAIITKHLTPSAGEKETT